MQYAHRHPFPWLAALCMLLLGLSAPLAAQICPANPAWITNPTLPFEVFGGPGATNCNFHQFEWESFLWMVAPSSVPGLLNFESPENFMPSYGLFVGANQKPTPWGQTPNVPLGACTGHATPGVRFMGRAVKTDPTFNDDIIQATGQPLIDQNTNLVYFEKTINRIWYDFAVSCQLYTSGCYAIAEKNPSFNFPAGTIELKTAWKILTPIEAGSGRFHVVQALVEEYVYDAKEDKYSATGQCQTETLGLVGFHLVSRSLWHPEFIWATFEHVDNNPDCDDRGASPPGGGSWSFFDSNCQVCPPVNTDVKPNPTQVCRDFPFGAGDPENMENIRTLNQNVHNLLPAGSVWRHYQLTGGIWTAEPGTSIGNLPPDSGDIFGMVCDGAWPTTNERGSLCNANTTMETFGQHTNCFDCHKNTTKMGGMTVEMAGITISHLRPLATHTGCGSGMLPPSCVPPTAMESALLPEPRPEMQPSHGPRYGTTEPAPAGASGETGKR